MTRNTSVLAWRLLPGITCVALLAAPAPARAQGVDLRPEVESVEIEAGVTNDVLAMRDGPTRILYEPPGGWTPAPISPVKLELKPQGVARALVELHAKPGRSSATTDDLVAMFRSLLPPEAVVNEEIALPVKLTSINGAPAHACSVRYQLGGEEIQRTVIFLLYRHAGFQFVVTTLAGDHEAVFKPFRGSLFTWHWEDDSHVQPTMITEKKNAE